VLQARSLLLQSVVIVLQHLDQLLEVVNLLSVVKFDLFQVDAIVVGNSSHSSKSSVFGHEVLDMPAEVVQLVKQLNILLVFLFLLLAKQVKSLHQVLQVRRPRQVSVHLLQIVDLVL